MKRYSTRTVVGQDVLVPWLAANGPLAYTPETPPDRDYFFQYGWILPEIVNPESNPREHRYFGAGLRDQASEVFAFWNNARRGRRKRVHIVIRHGATSGGLSDLARSAHQRHLAVPGQMIAQKGIVETRQWGHETIFRIIVNWSRPFYDVGIIGPKVSSLLPPRFLGGSRPHREVILRSSRDFASLEAYASFVGQVCTAANAQRAVRAAEELPRLQPLPAQLYPDADEHTARVSSYSTVRVKNCACSMPARLINGHLLARVTETTVGFHHAGVEVARYPRAHAQQSRIDYRPASTHSCASPAPSPGIFTARSCFPDSSCVRLTTNWSRRRPPRRNATTCALGRRYFRQDRHTQRWGGLRCFSAESIASVMAPVPGRSVVAPKSAIATYQAHKCPLLNVLSRQVALLISLALVENTCIYFQHD